MAVGYEGTPKERTHLAVTTMTSQGHIFGLAYVMDCVTQFTESPFAGGRQPENLRFYYATSKEFIEEIVQWAAKVYKDGGLQQPGLISVSMGMLFVQGARMGADTQMGGRFPDDSFRADTVLPCHELMENPDEACKAILDQLEFGFDLTVPKRK